MFVTMTEQNYKSGYVAIIGEPNVGKSTLLNAFLKQKISIVSRKPQTTRQKILGILSEENYQIIFFDTPGLLEPRYQLHQYMVDEIKSGLTDADLVVLMVDVQHPYTLDIELVKKYLRGKETVFLVINKIDKVGKQTLLPIIEFWHKQMTFKEIIPICAVDTHDPEIVLKIVIEALPVGPPFYPPDMVSEQPERFFVAELIRETIFERTQEEIPYATAVQVEPFISRGKKTYIKANIFVERPTQRAIILGEQGRNIKQLGSLARVKIEKFLDCEVFLDMWVNVKKDWKKDFKAMAELGYKSK
jgi:GTPase